MNGANGSQKSKHIMDSEVKKRWISLFVENYTGILAKLSGLFAAKAYNVESITAGTTDDPSITRITICLKSDDSTFEQAKKQLGRCIGIIRVIDFTEVETFMKELIFIKVKNCSDSDKDEIFKISKVFNSEVIDYSINGIMIQGVNTEKRNDQLISIMKKFGEIEIVRGGVVAIEKLSSDLAVINGNYGHS